MWSSSVSVCLMCLKTFNNEKDLKFGSTENQLLESSKGFLLFCERFLELPESLISKLYRNGNESESITNHFCSECREVQRTTLQLYQELCEVKLKLASKLCQWEVLLANGRLFQKKSKSSSTSTKLNSLLHQKLSEQLQLDILDTKYGARARGKEEVRKIRNILLSHCRNARNQMVTRNLEISLDRCSVPVPQGNHLGSMTTSFLLLDSTSHSDVDFNNDFTLTEGQNQNVSDLVMVKMENEVEVKVKEENIEDNFGANYHDHDDDHQQDMEIDTFMNDVLDYFTNNKQAHATSTSQAQEPSTSTFTSKLRPSVKSRRNQKNKKKPKRLKKTVPDLNEKPKSDELKVKPKPKVTKNCAQPDWIPCDVCGIAKPTPLSLWEHYRHHERAWRKKNKGKIAPFHCHFCWKSLSTDQCRRLHIECQIHNQSITTKKFSCYEEPCRGSPPFPSFKDLEAHFETVHTPGSNEVFKCSLCSWPFLNDGLRQTHELTHERHRYKEKMKCPKCGHADHSNFSALQTHFILEHTDLKDPKINGCHKCSTRFTCPWNLHVHLQTHNMEEDLEAGSSNSYHVCEQCGKQFASQTHLYHHVRAIHAKQQCNLCGEMVPSRSMSYHMRKFHQIGLSEDHACPICQKQCYSKHLVERHLRDVHHHGNDTDIEESCHICSKKYQRRGLLHRHLRVAHKIEAKELQRPARFVCPDCGMGYYYKTSLESHIDAKHRSLEQRKRLFPCLMCPKTFCRKCLLTKHLEEAHPDSVTPMNMDATMQSESH